MAVTIKELSEYCGISVSAVSKALNGYADIGEETKQKVLLAAQKLGYRPNAMARNLKIGKAFQLGVVYLEESGSGFTHNYFSPILEAFKNEAERRGYEISFLSANFTGNYGTKMSYLEHSKYRKVDGICVVCCNYEDPQIIELAQSELPFISIDQQVNHQDCVVSENYAGMKQLTDYVIEKGHQLIAYVHGEGGTSQKERILGFCKSLEEHGIPLPKEYLVESKYHNPECARRAVRSLLKLAKPPKCILVSDDFAALGAMDAIDEAGLHIPNDISIAGFDGVPILQMLKPKLTTVRQDTERIGRLAADLLIDKIENIRDRKNSNIYKVSTELLTGYTVQ
ncbi:MAG: LacI family DNA-binding transcriptional regulator [Eubacteriales bacterium]|nr:LacI family DNA-binding transcriptional regulator [Eubacteriales bacterium]